MSKMFCDKDRSDANRNNNNSNANASHNNAIPQLNRCSSFSSGSMCNMFSDSMSRNVVKSTYSITRTTSEVITTRGLNRNKSMRVLVQKVKCVPVQRFPFETMVRHFISMTMYGHYNDVIIGIIGK